jgi:hypothetical protein
MTNLEPSQVTLFREEYKCFVSESRHTYSKPIIRPLGSYDPTSPIADSIQVETDRGIDVTLTKEHFHQLIHDAEEGREHRYLRQSNPAVQQAYEQYRLLLALTRREQ